MKILTSSPVSAFGGLNFVIQEAIQLKINNLFNNNLPTLPKQTKYNWFDIIMSYWSVKGRCCVETHGRASPATARLHRVV